MPIGFRFAALRACAWPKLLAALLPLVLTAAGAPPSIGTETGQPLPRFAALRSDEVNLRRGPGTRYPIDWVFHRAGLPVQIQREFDAWRLIRTSDGTQGWVHVALLTPRRSVLVTGAPRVLRKAPADDAPAVARLKPGVIGRLLTCPADTPWCRVAVRSYRGWLRQNEVWGVSPGETVTG
ncbi:SH3 domain-containing protein [Rhodovastum atsumiense]|uniref:SH3 domain-containing protein n=1 Tax=Rhodovastum atsumiense TaxID=504468 RepID=A0A5M6J0P6_9PROT|nr:SH3 domain-containing protein [Rhodovastum atsumiense]KAA5613225.1 hypothetical protein F1189_05890 [Rhodovastum atsumiense]